MGIPNETELIIFLQKIAKRSCWYEDEDFNPYDYSGGNYDDAYYGGSEDGEATLARSILTRFFPNHAELS